MKRRPVDGSGGRGRNIRSFLSSHKPLLLFILLLAYLYLRGIGDHGLLDPLEGVNASIGLTMVSRGDLMHPGMGNAACAGRALGTWWLSCLSLITFGWREFAVRFWPAVAGLGMALAASLCARSRRGAWISAAISASMPLGFAVSQLASSHALYACCTSLALAAFIRVSQDGGRRWILAAHAAALAAFVVHGPEGLILPWVTLAIYAFVTGRSYVLYICWRWLPGALLSLAGVGGCLSLLMTKNPVLLTLMSYESPQFLDFTFMRALIFLMMGTAPWTGLVLSAASGALPRSREVLQDEEPAPRFFMVVWVLAFGFVAFVTGDLLALSACIPALAALVGDSLDEWIEQGRVSQVRRAVALDILILTPSIAIGAPAALSAFPLLPGAMLSIVPWFLIMALFLFAAWYYARTRQLLKFARNVSAVALLCLMPLAGVFDLLAAAGSIQGVGTALRDAVQRGDVIVQYAMNRPSLYFYTMHNYAMVNGPMLPGLTQQGATSLTDTALHLLWGGSDRAFLLIAQNQQPLSPLPQDVHNMFEANGMILLSNREAPLQAGVIGPDPASR